MVKSKKTKYWGHEEETIELDDGRKITCDKQLADLVRALNNAGIITLTSCQGGRLYNKRHGKKRKVKWNSKAHINIDLRSIYAFGADADYLTLQWTLKNPRKNWEDKIKLEKRRKQFLDQYEYKKQNR